MLVGLAIKEVKVASFKKASRYQQFTNVIGDIWKFSLFLITLTSKL